MNKRKLLSVLVASVLALGCIGAFAFADGDSGSSNTAYLATGTDSSVQIDQLYNAEVEETTTDVTKVQVSWELENIAASVTVNKIWDTTELKWVEDTSNPNTATATDVTAEFTFKNLSSVKVGAKVEFKAEDTFGEVTPVFTDNGVAEGEGIINLGTKADGAATVNEGTITATITPDAEKFKTFTTSATDAKFGTYTITIGKPTIKVGDVVSFGNYEQDNNTENGKEAISWVVLAKDGNKALVISDKALDCQPYNSSNANVTWETCTLRTWLNDTFLNNAFSTEEQKKIISSTVSADKNPDYLSVDPGNATTDKVFLLSMVEANKYFADNEARRCVATEYAKANGVETNDKSICAWSLRSPGYNQSRIAYVINGGLVRSGGSSVNFGADGVRPAMWINLES